MNPSRHFPLFEGIQIAWVSRIGPTLKDFLPSNSTALDGIPPMTVAGGSPTLLVGRTVVPSSLGLSVSHPTNILTIDCIPDSGLSGVNLPFEGSGKGQQVAFGVGLGIPIVLLGVSAFGFVHDVRESSNNTYPSRAPKRANIKLCIDARNPKIPMCLLAMPLSNTEIG